MSNLICERCGCLYDSKSNFLATLGGHAPDQCINLLREQNTALRSEQSSLFGELATICGGPGQPRKGETRNAYWLGRIRDLLIEERDKSRAYAVKYYDLIITEISHDIEEGIIFKEDLEPYLSQIANLLKKGNQ